MEWEQSKENVIPVKSGRSVKQLNAVLEGGLALSDQMQQKFENEVNFAEKCTMNEILDVYSNLFKWTRDNFPNESNRVLQVLEKCTSRLSSSSDFKNDLRYVKLWIEYADLVKTPGEIFSYMQSNKIGEKVALFWMAWAFVAEKMESFTLANQIFQKGIKKDAQPKEAIQKRYQQFQRRMSKRYINAMENGEVLEESKPKETQRPVLSTISTGIGAISAGQKAKETAGNNSKFQIFSDGPSLESDALISENSNWNMLGSDASRRKENTDMVTKWNNGLGLSKNKPISTAYNVYVDDECKDTVAQSATLVESGVLSIRKKLDKEGDGEHLDTASILKNPLQRHTQKTNGSSNNHVIMSSDNHVKCSIAAIVPDKIENKTGKLGSVIECDSKVVVDGAGEKTSKLINNGKTHTKFAILSDEFDVPVKPNIPSIAAPKFVIFDENENTRQNTELCGTINVPFLGELQDLEQDFPTTTINTKLAMQDIDMMFFNEDEENREDAYCGKPLLKTPTKEPSAKDFNDSAFSEIVMSKEDGSNFLDSAKFENRIGRSYGDKGNAFIIEHHSSETTGRKTRNNNKLWEDLDDLLIEE